MAIALRPPRDPDLDWALELARTPEMEHVLAPYAIGELTAARADPAHPGRAELLVIEADRERAGIVRLAVINPRSRIAAVRTLMIDAALRGRGVGRAALEALAARAAMGGLHRLEAEAYAFNEAGIRTFEAAGFAREGVRRQAWDRHGEWQDGVSLGRILGGPPTPVG